MFKKNLKTYCFLFSLSVCCNSGIAQLYVTIPWSSSLNETFGNGKANPGPLNIGHTDFEYVTYNPPGSGTYSVIFSNNDAGHIFFGPFPTTKPVPGYKMIVSYDGSFTNKIVFSDTVRNLCNKTKYLFWAGINNVAFGSCLYPDLSFNVETTSGTLIKSFQTGRVGGSSSEDNYSWYYGYYSKMPPGPPVSFYGGVFEVPAGNTDVVVKIITNPSTARPQCTATFELDNIIVMPIGPDVRVSSPKYPGGWITGSCFEGNVPLDLNAKIDSGYLDFGMPNYILDQYANPAFQWQQSLDEGYTWTDIPGETNINLSHNFNIPDTFWVRLRTSELEDISNQNCSNVSNIMKVEVDSRPLDFSFTTNSPVCTNGDLKLSVTGGATYNTYGPNGFSDNSAFPHVYHPSLADSGWYYSEITTFGGCKVVDSEFVKIIGVNPVTNPDRFICYGDTVHLHASEGVSYSWTPPDGLNNSAVSDPTASPTKSTKYEVMVTDNNGCQLPEDEVVNLRNGLLKAMISGPDIVCPEDIVPFKDSSIGQIKSWEWNLGNGSTSSLQNPTAQHYPPNGAFFSISLSITDTAGCEATMQKIIRSVNNCYIAVPNAFTPNNDGLNDFLYPLNAYKATHLEFKVFDRWGRLLFQTNDWTRKWDGTFGGSPQPAGVYVWMLSYTDDRQQQIFLKGTTLLVR
ncbi:MAG TPA: gliding motility-associated C-terminal domain-containing protein [Chitinophagaceae bacterium]